MRLILIYIRNFKYRFNGLLVKWFLTLLGCKVGKNFKCLTIPRFRVLPKKNIFIGDNVTIGENVLFEVIESGKLNIGDFVNFTRNIVICVNENIAIGNNVLVAENVSIRDGEHQIRKQEKIWKQPNNTKPVVIGNDVWIGAGTIVLQGSNIPDGVVVGAQSLVKNKQLEPFTVYAGNPLRKIKERE